MLEIHLEHMLSHITYNFVKFSPSINIILYTITKFEKSTLTTTTSMLTHNLTHATANSWNFERNNNNLNIILSILSPVTVWFKEFTLINSQHSQLSILYLNEISISILYQDQYLSIISGLVLSTQLWHISASHYPYWNFSKFSQHSGLFNQQTFNINTLIISISSIQQLSFLVSA